MSRSGITSNEAAQKLLKRRYRAEGRFRAYGVAAIVFAIASLFVLLASIVVEAVSAFTKHELSVEITLDPAIVDPDGDRDPDELRASVSAFSDLVRGELRERFPEAADDLALRRQLARMVSTLAGGSIAERAARDPSLVGQTVRVSVPVSDRIDLYLKGLVTEQRISKGGVPATLSRDNGAVSVTASGAFAKAHEAIADVLRRDVAARRAAVDQSEAAIARLSARLNDLAEVRAQLAAPDRPAYVTTAEGIVRSGDNRETALARTAGRALASGDLQPLRAALRTELERQARIASSEAAELRRKGADYASKAETAQARGEPVAPTRVIQAETAYLASDRRRVDLRLLEAAVARVDTLDAEGLAALASFTIGRTLAPLGEVAVAQGSDAIVAAVLRVNAIERAAAAAALQDQEARIAALTAEVAALSETSPERAAVLQAGAIPSAQSRRNRLARDLEAFEETAAEIAAAESAAARELAEQEALAQLGLDLGGPLAAAYALGAADAQGQGAANNLRALMLARNGLDVATAERDIERLSRKRDRDQDIANTISARIASPNQTLELDELLPSVLVEINGGVVKAQRISPDMIAGEELLPLAAGGGAAAGQWSIREVVTPEADRLVTDRQVTWAESLKASGDIRRVANLDLFLRADSTYPELAGLAAALAGSFWIMAVTLVLSLPVGVMAAIYLEEFAPRNRVTDFIEVNINNLAAVPSIVFGLLGAAVFINFFNLPRSAPVVGGLVLSLITLPTIIIATRAALGAVPPSIREGALAVGASLPQTVFHHVLPLAAPGILTGAIIGLARALGETAPLLLIGMVAFVAQPPASMFDSATALPVLVYKWSSAAERAWQPMTSAAIIVLLVFMFAMNALAVYLRRRLERRW